jgi:hypothetical protein
MDSEIDPAALAECVAPLSEDGRSAVHRYWDRVIREALGDSGVAA